MSKYLKFFLGISYILILTVFLYYVFSYIEIRRLSDFAYYKELQSNLNYYVNSNNFINLIYFFVFCIIWVFMLGFASPILIISGILFGKWIGTFATTISISIGALILYIFAGLFFSDLVQRILNKKFSKYIHLFKENEFIYFFAFRLSGGLGIPFFLQNLLPIIFKMNKSNYFFDMTAQDFMSKNFISVNPDDLASECLKIMAEKKIGCLAVMQEEKLVGIINQKDLVKLGI